VGIAGFSYAQTQDPPETPSVGEPEFPYGRGGLGRGSRGGMMGFGSVEGEERLLHDYLWPALVEAFGLTSEQAQAFETAHKTVHVLRSDLTPEERSASV
jgi:hypothetical protein